ncbi:MAG: YidC/Oxa1 family membrane protein insertase [Patescibacteria group bacterium]
MFELFTTFVYQPFFNVLVFFYWLLEVITRGNADMGVAVIFLTILIRVLLLPLWMAGQRREKDRRDIEQQVRSIEQSHASEPVVVSQKKKTVLRSNRRVLIAEIIGLFVQIVIALMLWQMFNTGLTGEDFDLIYGFMPAIDVPFNLEFMGRYDLTQFSFQLNFVQAGLLLILEVISAIISPYRISRNQMVKLQFILPVVSFFLFWIFQLPAGKKLFIITTLCFSILLTTGRAIQVKFQDYRAKKEAEAGQGEKVVVDVK